MDNKKITLDTLATLAGVSKATVSRVLNGNAFVSEDIKSKVQLVIAETGYKSKTKSLNFGLDIKKVTIISGDFLGNAHSFYNEILSGVKKESHRLALDLDMFLIKQKTTLEQIENKVSNSSAILLIGVDNKDVLGLIKKHNTPTVIINGNDFGMGISSISPDYTLGGQLVTNELIHLGHKKIKLVTSQHRYSLVQRTDGFRHALDLNQIPYDINTDVLDLSSYARDILGNEALQKRIITGQAGMDFGASEILDHAVENGEFDGYSAVFCVCDMVAYALLDAFENHSIAVPEQKSVVGFDNLEMSTMTSPSLTTISTNFPDLAKAALHMLIKEINQTHAFTSRLSVGVSLIKRDSSAPCPI
ncbi:LacI family DNA-binding transcriptional regulator [Photobacterium sanctipauli]|uniref:LacI family DNA-binding transcriptional regulator n=1 Tax=Photobacterium sanctipauli TaxID=1342794 RepID=UPI0013047C8C|nr:LacI family DNA-binding transcriptional regulator [Photobacterium sanctipauli]